MSLYYGVAVHSSRFYKGIVQHYMGREATVKELVESMLVGSEETRYYFSTLCNGNYKEYLLLVLDFAPPGFINSRNVFNNGEFIFIGSELKFVNDKFMPITELVSIELKERLQDYLDTLKLSDLVPTIHVIPDLAYRNNQLFPQKMT